MSTTTETSSPKFKPFCCAHCGAKTGHAPHRIEDKSRRVYASICSECSDQEKPLIETEASDAMLYAADNSDSYNKIWTKTYQEIFGSRAA